MWRKVSGEWVSVNRVSPQCERGFFRNSSGAIDAMEVVGLIVGLAIAMFILAIILPPAFENFFAVDTTNYTADVITLWNIIPLFMILAIVIAIIAIALWYLRRQA